MNAWELLPAIRDLYRRHPEFHHHKIWEIQILLWSLGYTADFEDEGEIRAACEVVWRGWGWTGEAA